MDQYRTIALTNSGKLYFRGQVPQYTVGTTGNIWHECFYKENDLDIAHSFSELNIVDIMISVFTVSVLTDTGKIYTAIYDTITST